jgi:hypothetical protein
MHEPEHIATRSARAHVHLHGPIGLAPNELIAKVHAQLSRPIGASSVRDNNFRFGRSITQMLKKWTYERRLIQNRNNDRELRLIAFHQIGCRDVNTGIERPHDASAKKWKFKLSFLATVLEKPAKHPHSYQQTKLKRRSLYDHQANNCSSYWIILHTGCAGLCTGAS